jgi:hypothetical protein
VPIFRAEDDIDQRALVDHVIDAAAGIPAVVARRAVEAGARRAANAGDGGARAPFRFADAQPPVAKIIQRSKA